MFWNLPFEKEERNLRNTTLLHTFLLNIEGLADFGMMNGFYL